MIKLITGPMKSSKSKELINMIKNNKFKGSETLVFKPKSDTRTPGIIKSRTGSFVVSHEVNGFDDILTFIRKVPDIKVVFIDEIQFIEPQAMRAFFIECTKNNIDVVASGLNLTSELFEFSTTAKFMCYADEVIILKAICEKCGAPASLSEYTMNKIYKQAIGDSEYIATCEECHKFIQDQSIK